MPLPFFAMTALLKLAYILVDTIRILLLVRTARNLIIIFYTNRNIRPKPDIVIIDKLLQKNRSFRSVMHIVSFITLSNSING